MLIAHGGKACAGAFGERVGEGQTPLCALTAGLLGAFGLGFLFFVVLVFLAEYLEHFVDGAFFEV